MNFPEDIQITGETISDVLESCNRIVPTLSPELRKTFVAIRSNYIAAFQLEEACARLRDRSVSQVIAEYEPINVKPIASGEEDGVKFALYDPPPQDGRES